MAPILDKLKNFIEVKLNIKNVKITLVNIRIVRDENKAVVVHDKNKQLYDINVAKLDKKEYAEIEKFSRQYVGADKMLLEDKSCTLLNELYKFKEYHNSTLVFFKHIIPKSDYIALESSLFVREKFDNDEPIADLKRGITMRFGDRGRNICNLCTAKYFEEFLIPLFNADKEPFDNIYEDLIKNSMLAVFVNQSMEVDDIPGEIKKKIAISKKYGFNFIHIHGIGQTNIDTIKKFIDSEKINLFNIVKIIYSNPKEHILVVELLFS